MVVDRVQRLRVLVVITFRPEFTPPWTGHAHVAGLTLSRLARREGVAIIERLAGGKPLPSEVLEQILAKTDGVPLFVEELTKTVLESALLRDAGDRFELAGPLPPLAVPATLHDSLMARLDRLPAVKEVAQIGAAIGREFPYELLAAVAPMPGNNLPDVLSELEGAGLVFGRGVPPEASYTFKHALVQDAAYNTLLRSRREQLHCRIAQALEERFPDRVAAEPELLAHHYTRGNQFVSAVEYWRRAGESAVERLANLEAIAHLTTGLELLKSLPESPERDRQEIRLLSALVIAHLATKGFGAPEAMTSCMRVRGLCEALGDEPGLFTATWNLWIINQARSQLRTAHDLSNDLIMLAEGKPDSDRPLQAHHAAWTTNFYLGEFEAARAHADRGRDLYDLREHRMHTFQYGGHDPGVCCRSFGSLASYLLGYPTRALELLHEGFAIAKARAHPLSTTLVYELAVMLHQYRREPQQVREFAERSALLAKEQGLERIFWVVVAQIVANWALVQMGYVDEGIAGIRSEITTIRSLGTLQQPYYLGLLAESWIEAGALEEAHTTISEALDFSERTSERWWDTELHRLRGMLLLAQSRHDLADACFQQAIAVARCQNAKALELRATTALARLWCGQGRRAEARDLLAPVYGWFADGFDTADLKESKVLLDELR